MWSIVRPETNAKYTNAVANSSWSAPQTNLSTQGGNRITFRHLLPFNAITSSKIFIVLLLSHDISRLERKKMQMKIYCNTHNIAPPCGNAENATRLYLHFCTCLDYILALSVSKAQMPSESKLVFIGNDRLCSVSPWLRLPWLCHFWLCCVGVQEERPIKTPEVEEFSDDLYGDEHNELSVSTVTVGTNITDFEVCALDSVSRLCEHVRGDNPDCVLLTCFVLS